MAQQIGLDNNPAGSAIALGLAKVFKEWLLKHTSGKANNLVSKISTKSIGKALIYANVANAANETLADFLPHVNAAITWVGALPANILNQTIGRIPVLGEVFRKLHNFVTEAVSTLADFIGLDAIADTGRTLKISDPNSGFETNIDWKTGKTGVDNTSAAQDVINNKGDDNSMGKLQLSKMRNHPKFYENLDLHKTFTVPGAYTKTTVVNGTLATPILVAHRLTENPVPDKSALLDRLNQKFSLIKAVRGLSATNYSVIDLANYERLGKISLLQYYVTKKVIQAAKTYSLIQTGIGDRIISSLGFNPSEVRENLANYETLLCQMHRFISNNLPITGTWIERLEYLVGANIPDYSDAKVATIHTFSVCMTDVFYRYDEGHTTDKFTFDCIPGSNGNDYDSLLSSFTNVQTALTANLRYQQLIADYFGAFGAKAIWSDKDYPAYSKPLDIRNGDDDLNREQVKNAFYLNNKVEFITINEGVQNKKIRFDLDDALNVQVRDYQFGKNDTFDSSKIVTLSYINLLDDDCYQQMYGESTITGLGDENAVLIPDMNGVGAQAFGLTDATPKFIMMDNHETIYSLHKDGYTEGQLLDISQFKARSIAAFFYAADSGDKITGGVYYKTQEYAMVESTVYVFGSNGSTIVSQEYVMCNEVISDDDLQSKESPVDFPDEIMCWCLIDWMPFTHFTFFGYNADTTAYSPRDILAIDMDSFGSLDDRAFVTSINYAIYSLQGANLAVGDKKRISNLNDVYKDKPSKRG